MVSRTRIAAFAGGFAICATLSGCAGGELDAGFDPVAEASCAGPVASVPQTATAGDSITLNVRNLWSECYDTGQAGNAPTWHEVTVTMHNTSPDAIVSVTAPVTKDAQATVVLDIPATASGNYTVEMGTTVLGELTVTPND